MNEPSPHARQLLEIYRRHRPGDGARERNLEAVQRRIAARQLPPRSSLRRQLAWGVASALAAALVLLVLDRVLPRADVAGVEIAPAGSQAVHGDASEGPADRLRPPGRSPKPLPPAQADPQGPTLQPVPLPPPAAKPTKERPPASAAVEEPSDSLAIETQLVARARSALSAGDLDAAQAALDEHRRRFPDGALEEDRVAYTTIVACQRGNAEARRAFLRRYPRSPHRPRVDEACR